LNKKIKILNSWRGRLKSVWSQLTNSKTKPYPPVPNYSTNKAKYHSTASKTVKYKWIFKNASNS